MPLGELKTRTTSKTETYRDILCEDCGTVIGEDIRDYNPDIYDISLQIRSSIFSGLYEKRDICKSCLEKRIEEIARVLLKLGYRIPHR